MLVDIVVLLCRKGRSAPPRETVQPDPLAGMPPAHYSARFQEGVLTPELVLPAAGYAVTPGRSWCSSPAEGTYPNLDPRLPERSTQYRRSTANSSNNVSWHARTSTAVHPQERATKKKHRPNTLGGPSRRASPRGIGMAAFDVPRPNATRRRYQHVRCKIQAAGSWNARDLSSGCRPMEMPNDNRYGSSRRMHWG